MSFRNRVSERIKQLRRKKKERPVKRIRLLPTDDGYLGRYENTDKRAVR